MKYSVKWRIGRSRILFALKVIWRWLQGKPGLLYSPGVHMITGPSGSGKTLIMNIVLLNILRLSGFAWANMDEFKNDHVKVFDIDELFKDGKQQFRLDKKMWFSHWVDDLEHPGNKKDIGKYEFCKAVVIDELNARFNRRMNRQTDYNDVFVPMIKFTVTHRHQIADRLYFIGQSLLLQDGQIQAILKVRHDIRSSKRWRYYFFREKGKMLYLPKKIIVEHYMNTGVDQLGNIIWTKARYKSKIKVKPKYFESYDHQAFDKLFDGLPIYSQKK